MPGILTTGRQYANSAMTGAITGAANEQDKKKAKQALDLQRRGLQQQQDFLRAQLAAQKAAARTQRNASGGAAAGAIVGAYWGPAGSMAGGMVGGFIGGLF